MSSPLVTGARPRMILLMRLTPTFSINTNKVTKVISGKNPIYSGGNGIANGALATRTVEGEPIGEFFGYKVAGIFQNQSQITGSAQPNARPGDFMYTGFK